MQRFEPNPIHSTGALSGGRGSIRWGVCSPRSVCQLKALSAARHPLHREIHVQAWCRAGQPVSMLQFHRRRRHTFAGASTLKPQQPLQSRMRCLCTRYSRPVPPVARHARAVPRGGIPRQPAFQASAASGLSHSRRGTPFLCKCLFRRKLSLLKMSAFRLTHPAWRSFCMRWAHLCDTCHVKLVVLHRVPPWIIPAPKRENLFHLKLVFSSSMSLFLARRLDSTSTFISDNLL